MRWPCRARSISERGKRGDVAPAIHAAGGSAALDGHGDGGGAFHARTPMRRGPPALQLRGGRDRRRLAHAPDPRLNRSALHQSVVDHVDPAQQSVNDGPENGLVRRPRDRNRQRAPKSNPRLRRFLPCLHGISFYPIPAASAVLQPSRATNCRSLVGRAFSPPPAFEPAVARTKATLQVLLAAMLLCAADHRSPWSAKRRKPLGQTARPSKAEIRHAHSTDGRIGGHNRVSRSQSGQTSQMGTWTWGLQPGNPKSTPASMVPQSATDGSLRGLTLS